jgi:broad-specificity NMP kinase
MKNILIIIRGIPGSGKTSFSNLLKTKAICTADDYHMRNGIYDWKPERVSAAHDWCQRKCRRFMEKKIERIIVENRHGNKNIHNVPEETLIKMKNRFNIQL